MDESLLARLGLNTNQAHTYRLLIERKSLRPTQLAKITKESRANCYALLDKLVELGLAKRIDVDKKLTYFPESPIALEAMINKQIVDLQGKLRDVKNELPRMLSVFNDNRLKPRITMHTQVDDIKGMYKRQLEADGADMYFVRSLSDVMFFGIEPMESIRFMAAKYKKTRYGITPSRTNSAVNVAADSLTHLKRAWVKKEEYSAPVEWVVSGDLVHIISMTGDGSGIEIKDKIIADSLRQILSMLHRYVRGGPDYHTLANAKLGTKKPSPEQLDVARKKLSKYAPDD